MNGLREDNIKIGYQGARGSFSEEAMIEFFGENQNTFSYDKFEDVFLAIQKNEIDIAVLTIPKTGAVGVAEKLVQNGIKAIWNFAHVDLNVPVGIQVENVHLSDSLMKLSYNLSRYGKGQPKD